MRSFQTITLYGGLGKDPIIRATTSGKKVASFSVATDESYTANGQENKITEWHNIVAWGEMAELAEAHLKKGSHVFIRGKNKTRKWEKDGITRYSTEINAELLIPAVPKGSAPQQQQQSYNGSGMPPAAEDDLPF